MSWKLLFVPLLVATGVVLAEEVREAESVAADTKALVQTAETDEDVPEAEEVAEDTQAQAQTEKDPKLISGMSILGNQEAPKSLVIVPWKGSEIGDSLGISTMLDDSRQPIDKDVFMRELSYYEIRSEGTP